MTRVPDTPSPVPSDTMQSCQVLLFGDLATSFESELRRLLHAKNNATLQSFFEQVAFAFRHEFSQLPQNQQDLFPHFTTLIDLLSKLGETEGTPILKFALLTLCQIGQFIRYYGEGSRPYPNAANSFALGLCTGSYAAAAISTSRTISELIPAGIEAVLVAFRTALHSLELRNDIERPSKGASQSWSVVVSTPEASAIKMIKTFSEAKGIPTVSAPYIASVTPTNVTISGPPSVLKELLSTTTHRSHYLSIDSPYHSSVLFRPNDVEKIVGQFYNPAVESYKPRIPLLSPATGELIEVDDFRTLMLRTVSETLCEQVRWDFIVQKSKDLFHGTTFQQCTILPISSNAGQLVSSALTKTTKLAVTISDVLNTSNLDPKPNRPTGKFEQSKIAIIGYSGRFPDAASNEEYWELLRAGRDVHRTIPEDRFNWKTHFDPTGKTKNTSRVQYGCFIKEPGLFDSRFFNMSPRECENSDPAQRLAITTAYEALEMAGLVPNRTPSTQQDRIGVFFGVTSDDWREVNSGQNIDTYFIPGGNRAFVPGRISYFFRFSGPSLSIDTACSSSLAAIQSACSYLWRGDCDTAVAGGTNVLTNPDNFAGLDRGHFLSTTGNCNAFDDGASGYCRADAVGSVVLKRLEDAIADNDPIHGVIGGTYTNHCGQTESITRPHEGDQVSVFKKIMRHTNMNPLDISYIEMHGTGTQAGDATEMKSVLSVFVPEKQRMPAHPLYIGSAKANIGHGESASGVSSLIKVLMMMKNNEIPPHCGIKTKINHNYPLDLKERNVNIALKPTSWKRTDCPAGKRAVFLNNFSAAGGNTALLLEDSPIRELDTTTKDPRSVHPVAVTAKTMKSLKMNIESLVAYLDENPETSLPALSYTTTARRQQHNYRTVISTSSIASLRESLVAKATQGDVKSIPLGPKVAKIVFSFTGQGSFYSGIGKQLFDTVFHFKADVLRFDRIAQLQGFPSFLPLVDGSIAESEIEGMEPVKTHLALVCVQIALCRLWISWGVKPSLSIGHSLGEYAALFAAGVITASDAIFLVGSRAQLLSKHCTAGTHAMLAIKATIDAVKPLLAESSCEVACANQPNSTVISGPVEQINGLMEKCSSQKLEGVKLDIPYAFHSAQVDPILKGFEKAAGNVRFSAPAIPYMSPLLGKVVSDDTTLGASYLTQACRNAVNYHGVLEAAKSSKTVDERTIWLEIGSHPVCSGMTKGTLGPQTVTIPTLRKGMDTWKVISNGLEQLHLSGIDIQWNEYHRDFKGSHQCLSLPRYSWDLKNYWIQYRNDFCLTKGDDLAPKQIAAPVEETSSVAAVYISPSVQRVLEEDNSTKKSTLLAETDIHDPRLKYVIEGHKVNTAALCPSSLYADMAMTVVDYMLKAVNMQNDTTSIDVGEMKATRPLLLNNDVNSQMLRISASADWSTKTASIVFFSANAQGKKTVEHATCVVRICDNSTWLQDWKRNSYLIKSRIQSLQKAVDGGDGDSTHKMKSGLVYKLFSTLVDYDPRYKGIQEAVLDSNELEATAQVTFQVGDEGFLFHPCWVDSLGQIAGFIMNGNDNVHSKENVFINHGWDAIKVVDVKKFQKGKTYQTYNRMQLENGTNYVGDTYILDGGEIVAVYEGIKFQGVPRKALDSLLPSKSGASKSQAKPTTAPVKSVQAPAPKAAPKAVSAPVKQKKATTNSTVMRVMAIIAEESGVDLTEFKPETEFAELGIDSLLSLTISGRIREEVGIDLQSTLFAEYPTVKELTAFLDDGNDQTPPSPPSSDEDDVSASPNAVFTPNSEDDTDSTSIAETNNVIEIIRQTIAEETGVDVVEITMTTILTEIGMDSLLTLTIMGKLSEMSDMEFPQTLFADCETLHEVEEALGLNSKKQSSSPPTTAFKHDDPPHATSILLQGSSKTATKTLWLFPDGSGSATSYSSLAKISPDVVVYGLNCPWVRTPENLRGRTLEQLSTKYLTEIRRRQPTGPYYFGGWSAGGICAYEASQQLLRSGEATARLILIDSPNPIGLENPPQRMYDFFESLGIFGTDGKPPPPYLRPHFDAFIGTLDNYQVKPFSGPSLQTHLVYARDGICKHPSDPRPELKEDDPREMLWLINNRTDFNGDGWAQLVGKQNLKIAVLDDVNHFSLVENGPKMAELGDFIRSAME